MSKFSRSVWSGDIQCSFVTFPVKLYTAVNSDESGIKLKEIHKGCNGPVGRLNYCKKCEKQNLSSEEVIKAFEYDKNLFVPVTEDDKKNVKLTATKTIELAGFVEQDEISPALYESIQFIAPEKEHASKSYALFHKVLWESGKVGIGTVVIRDRERPVVIAPFDGRVLALYHLRYTKEINDPSGLEFKESEVDPKQAELLLELVESMKIDFSSQVFEDRYTKGLRKIIEEKAAGKEIIVREDETIPVIPGDITETLQMAIKAIKESKGIKKPASKKEKAVKK